MSKKEIEIMNKPIEETEIVSPRIYTKEEVTEVEKHAKKVVSELKKAEKAFTAVACELAYLHDNDRYKVLDTALTFEQFAQSRFGFKKSQAYALINLANRFGICSDTGTYSIKEDYKDYSHTKLINMSSLTDKEISE